jgi:hypothetical protein
MHLFLFAVVAYAADPNASLRDMISNQHSIDEEMA